MKERLLQKLERHGQQHVLQFWDELDEDARVALTCQIESLDLEALELLFRDPEPEEDLASLAMRAAPPKAIRLAAEDREFSADEARDRGEQELRAGRVGVALVAGGQGTRLGFAHPKGMLPVGPVSGATLFQILFERILAVSKTYGVSIPLYLMTSPATDEETRAYLQENDRFGLSNDDVTLFCQSTMPAVDAESGRLLLDRPGRLFASPDGHGGMLEAMRKSGALDNMLQRGLTHLFYFQVDNPLATVCDPEFIGYHLLYDSEYTLQVVAKESPTDKVGNVVTIDGVSRVIEYSDLPLAAAEQRNDDGSLTVWAGSLAVHMFDVQFLARAAAQRKSLPFHRALKRVAFVGSGGKRVEPADPNAIKYERFIFDLLPLARKSICVEIDPKLGFAPVKNAAGAQEHTVKTAQQQIMALHRQWLRSAGAVVADDVRVEISPLYALDVRQLSQKIDAATRITTDTCFR